MKLLQFILTLIEDLINPLNIFVQQHNNGLLKISSRK